MSAASGWRRSSPMLARSRSPVASASCWRRCRSPSCWAVALADPFEAVPAGQALPPLPDVREEGGWVLSSRPLAVKAEPGAVVIERLRQAVSPDGGLSEQLTEGRLDELSPETLELEASEAGLTPGGRRKVP